MPLHRLDPRRPEGLPRLLSDKLAAQGTSSKGPIWAICCEEPILQREALDALRACLQKAGYEERISDTPDRSFDWAEWLANAKSRSLLSDKRCIELRLPTGKPGLEGSKAIQAWCQNPPEDVCLSLVLPRVDKTLASSSWFKALEQHGQVISIQELPASDRPQWIANRLAGAGLSAEPKAVAWLAHRCEGNLTAAAQEVDKLAHLPRPPGQEKTPISLEEMQSAITDQARFNPFQLGETLVAGSASRSLRMIRGLREEGEPLPILIWSAANACRRLPEARAREAMRQIALIDTMAKGLSNEQDPWVALERLALFLDQPNSPY